MTLCSRKLPAISRSFTTSLLCNISCQHLIKFFLTTNSIPVLLYDSLHYRWQLFSCRVRPPTIQKVILSAPLPQYAHKIIRRDTLNGTQRKPKSQRKIAILDRANKENPKTSIWENLGPSWQVTTLTSPQHWSQKKCRMGGNHQLSN